MSHAKLEAAIEAAWEARDGITPDTRGETREAIEHTLDALDSGKLRGAALDVFPAEPKSNEESFESPLRRFDNVILTPHVAGSLGVEIHRMTELILTEIERFIGTGTLAHEIRREDWATMA